MTKPLTRAEVADLCGCKIADIPANPMFSLSRYNPPGPVGAAYIRSTGPIDGIMGPGGSGKTIASFFKLVRYAVGAMPVCKDGVVRVRCTVLRDNYRSLYRTTLRSWFAFFPPDYPGSTFFGGADRPAQHHLKLATVRDVDGAKREVPVELTMDFFAVGDVAIEELLKSYETSAGYCNEADQLAFRVIPFLFGRTGRYPALEQLPPGTVRPRVVCFDMNPPKPNHPLLKAALRGTFKEPAIGHNGGPALDDDAVTGDLAQAKAINFFQQPSGLDPAAENRGGKTYDEYQQDLLVMSEEDGRRMVHGLPGYATDGKPVYAREWSRRKHVAAGRLAVLPGLPLHIGFDQGLSPAAVLGQKNAFGQARIYRELYLGHGVGIERFLEALLSLLTQPPFLGLPAGVYTADPAGFYGADRQNGESTWAEAVAKGLGHAIYPAPTNEPLLRHEAVRQRLTHDIDAQTPGVIFDPEGCPMLLEGFEAEYKHPKFKDGAPKAYGDGVVDNEITNPHDALQYWMLGVYGRAGVINEAAKAGRAGNVVSMLRDAPMTSPGDFNVWNT
jgi:hypothetical protein